MARIGIIGAGAYGTYGTALACVARRAGHEVVPWAHEPEVVSAARGAVTDYFFHQQGAQPPAFQVGAHDDREFRVEVIRVGDRAHHAPCLGVRIAIVHAGDERHLAVAINLGETRERVVRGRTHRMDTWNAPAFVRLRAAHLARDVRGTVCENCIAYS